MQDTRVNTPNKEEQKPGQTDKKTKKRKRESKAGRRNKDRGELELALICATV